MVWIKDCVKYQRIVWLIFLVIEQISAQGLLNVTTTQQQFVTSQMPIETRMHQAGIKTSDKIDADALDIPQKQTPQMRIESVALHHQLIQVASVVQQAVLSALSFSNRHGTQLEQLALRYFSPEAWGQFMTPDLRRARHAWHQAGYDATVSIQGFPEMTAQSHQGHSQIKAVLPVTVHVFQGAREVASEAVTVQLLVAPTRQAPFWVIQHWAAQLTPFPAPQEPHRG